MQNNPYSLSFESKLQELFSSTPLPSSLREAASYALFPGGKRFRPLLALYVASLFGPVVRGFDAAAALETLHTYSLIHDDLPCMDNDDLRRGKPTLHKAFNEARALLTGDFFLNWSFQILGNVQNFSAEEKIELINILAEAAGGDGMVGSQLLEMENPRPEDLTAIYRGKTGKLIEAAVAFGGIIGKAKELEKWREIGRNLGLAFQLQDDLDDLESDLKTGKLTMGTWLGEKKLKELLEETLELCRPLQGALPEQFFSFRQSPKENKSKECLL